MKSSHIIMKRFVLVLLLVLSLCVICCYGEDAMDVTPMEQAEKEALYSAIQGFVGNWWNGSDLYPDPCGWTPIEGVSCDIYGGLWYVTALSIGPVHDNSLGCAVNVEFRPQLFELKHLKSLSFFNCFTSSHQHPISIPENGWEKLSGSLETLEFRSNPGLIGQVPTSYGGLVKLQSLVLIENGLTGELPRNIANLNNLKRLVISGNWFSGHIPDMFGEITELLILDLSRNLLTGSLPLTLGNLTSLLKLDLSNNQLEGELPKEIGYLKNLTLLDLRSNNFSGGLTKSLEEMYSLEEMVLANNPIGGDLVSLEWRKLQISFNADASYLNPSAPSGPFTSSFPDIGKSGISNLSFAGDVSMSAPPGSYGGSFQAMGSVSDQYGENRHEYPIHQRNSMGPNRSPHHPQNNPVPLTRNIPPYASNSSVDSVFQGYPSVAAPKVEQETTSSHYTGGIPGIPLPENNKLSHQETKPSVSLPGPIASLQPDQLAQLASTLLGQQRQTANSLNSPMGESHRQTSTGLQSDNQYRPSQNYAMQSSNQTTPEFSTSQFGQVQQLQMQMQQQASSIPTTMSPQVQPGIQGSQQPQNTSSNQEADGDPQKRLQATLQLAAALLQQIQRGKGT